MRDDGGGPILRRAIQLQRVGQGKQIQIARFVPGRCGAGLRLEEFGLVVQGGGHGLRVAATDCSWPWRRKAFHLLHEGNADPRHGEQGERGEQEFGANAEAGGQGLALFFPA